MAKPGSQAPTPGQIWFIEEPRLGGATHGHFALVTQCHGDATLTINFIASDRSSSDDFLIESGTAEFALTGLNHTSHLLRDHAYTIRVEQLIAGKHKGLVMGELKKQIEDWWGEALK